MSLSNLCKLLKSSTSGSECLDIMVFEAFGWAHDGFTMTKGELTISEDDNGNMPSPTTSLDDYFSSLPELDRSWEMGGDVGKNYVKIYPRYGTDQTLIYIEGATPLALMLCAARVHALAQDQAQGAAS